MKRKFSILFAWLVRTTLFFFPDIPLIMRLRGMCYSLAMRKCGRNFQVSHSAILNSISELTVGNNVYIANNASAMCGGGVILHNNVLIGPGVVISSDNHTFQEGHGFRFGKVKFGKVVVGEGAWLCANSVVTMASVFPANAVLGPSSVFTSSSDTTGSGTASKPTIYSGVPARMLITRNRHDQ